jgi:hypothetical protein
MYANAKVQVSPLQCSEATGFKAVVGRFWSPTHFVIRFYIILYVITVGTVIATNICMEGG